MEDTWNTELTAKPGDRDRYGFCPITQRECEFEAHQKYGGKGIYWGQVDGCVFALPGLSCSLVNTADFWSKVHAQTRSITGEDIAPDIAMVPVSILRVPPESHEVWCAHCEQSVELRDCDTDEFGELQCSTCRERKRAER